MARTIIEWPIEQIKPTASMPDVNSCDQPNASKGANNPGCGSRDAIVLRAPFTSIVRNDTQAEAIAMAADRLFAIPPNSMFLLCDLMQVCASTPILTRTFIVTLISQGCLHLPAITNRQLPVGR